MARTGGQSTAEGVSFQTLCIARAIIDVYQGQAVSVRAEVPPRADFGEVDLLPVKVDDYVVEREAGRLYCQAKSNAPGGGSWTVDRLIHEGVLKSFLRQIQTDSASECRLVTPNPCPLLGSLAEQARNAEGLDEYLAGLSQQDGREFRRLCTEFALEDSSGHEFLSRCSLETRSSSQLRADLVAIAEAVFADPRAAVDSLVALALSAMTKSQRLDKCAVDGYFAERGTFTAPGIPHTELLQAVKGASARLRTVNKEIAGVHILQPVVNDVFHWILASESAGPKIGVFLDEAGTGKTVAMSVLLNRLDGSDYVTLGIKVDGLSFSSPAELATAIGLPASIPSVVQALKAAGHQVAVLIDQVDALSSAMSRDIAPLTAVVDLVARLTSIHDVPVVVACRSFDWEYDYRLRSLADRHPSQFRLSKLSDDQLKDVLSVLDVDLDDLHPVTVEVVRCPLRLRVLADIMQGHREQGIAWDPRAGSLYTLQSLYGEFWGVKMRKAQRSGVSPSECEEAVSCLASRMHDSQELAAPEAILANRQPALEWLNSEGIISRNGSRLSFFHQTFFDFVFARQFAQSTKSLVAHLLSTDQGLFHRPMTRQTLEYLRDVGPKRYLRELQDILENPKIRKHLRWMTLTWVGRLTDPWSEELALLEPLLAAPDTRRRLLWMMTGRPGWFDLLGLDRIQRWLCSKTEDDIDGAVSYLAWSIEDRQDDVVSLLSPYANRSEKWNNRLAFCLSQLRSRWAESSADLLLCVLGSPLTNLDQDANGMPYWARALVSLAKAEETKACDALGTILNRYDARWLPREDGSIAYYDVLVDLKEGERRLPATHDFTDTVRVLSQKAPERLVEIALPWLHAKMDLSCSTHNPLYFRDNYQYWRYRGETFEDASQELLAGVATAAVVIATRSPQVFRQWARKMLEGDIKVMQFMVAEAYAACPAEYATDAAHFLCADNRRLRLVAENCGNLSVRLIKACCQHWGSRDLRRVEALVLETRRRGRSGSDRYSWDDLQTLSLLQAFERDHLSDLGKSVLGQLERKHPASESHTPETSEWHGIDPPIPGPALKRMTDRGWLGAMKKYHDDKERSVQPGRLVGGRRELAQAIQARAKDEPERFCRLALAKMDGTVHPDYIAAILSGAAEGGAPIERIDALVEAYETVLETDNIRTVCSVMDRYAGQDVPKKWLELLQRWALEAHDPSGSRSNSSDGSYLTEGWNTDRGHAVWTLAGILLKSARPAKRECLELASQVAKDPSLPVRAVCIRFLAYAMSADPPYGCEVFKSLVRDDFSLLREGGAYECVYTSLTDHAERMLWAILRMMLDPEKKEAQENGAKLACLAAFTEPATYVLRNACLSGSSVSWRKGAAAVYARNCTAATVGQECRERLMPLLNDDEPEVREEATGFLQQLTICDLQELEDFVIDWLESRAVEDGAVNAARMLEKHPTANPALTLRAAQAIIESLGSELTNVQRRHGGVTYHLTPAILNVYHRSTDQKIRNWAMDLFERLEEIGCPQVGSAMEAADRF